MRESQGAKLSSRTLRSSAMAGCDVRMSHPAKFFELFSAKPNLKGDRAKERLAQRWEGLRRSGREAALEREQGRLRVRMHDISEFIKLFKEGVRQHLQARA